MTTNLAFAPNYAHILEIDLTPGEATPKWAYALHGITSCVPSSDETTNEDEYYHNLGMVETDVENIKVSLALTGNREYGDPAQDYIQSLALETGSGRKGRYRWTQPDGKRVTGECTYTDIVFGSAMGESSAKGDFGYTINLNSVNVADEGGKTDLPESITASDVTVAVDGTEAVGATVSPATANQYCHYGIEDTAIATVDSDGNVKGVAVGETKLTVKAASKPTVVKTVKVTVAASI